MVKLIDHSVTKCARYDVLTAKTSPKGQIVIPKAIRERLGMKAGSRVELELVSDHIEIRPLPENPIQAIRGSLKSTVSLAQKLIREHHHEVQRDATKR